MAAHCLRNPALLNANNLYESHPEWHLTAEERRNMLQRERRAGINETQMDAVADTISEHEDTEMADFDEDINQQRINDSPPDNARTNKDLSGRQRCVLQDIINNEFRVGDLSD